MKANRLANESKELRGEKWSGSDDSVGGSAEKVSKFHAIEAYVPLAFGDNDIVQ